MGWIPSPAAPHHPSPEDPYYHRRPETYSYCRLNCFFIRLFKMNSAGIIICHGGYWRNNAYENGVEDFLRIPPDGMTFLKMRTQIESIVGVDGSPYECSVYGMVDSPRGGKVRMKIKDDDDLNYMMGLSSTLIVFVTLTPRITSHPVQNNFLNLLNAQNTQTPPYSNQPTNPYIFPPLVGHMSNVVPEFPPFSQHNSSVVPTLGVDDFAQTKNAVSENEIYIDKHNDDWVPNDDSDDEEEEDSLDDDDDDVDDDDRGNDGGGGGGYDDRFSKVNHHSVSNIGTSSDHDDVHDDAWQETVTRGKQW